MPNLPPSAPPPLAGLCGYDDAARVGVGVEANVRRLLRLHWVERRLFEIMVGRIPSTPEWEVKGALALHQWLAAEHADLLRRRIVEMRSPPPRMDRAPDAALEGALREVEASEGTVALLGTLYGVLLPALREACARHAREINPLVDHPTRRVLSRIRPEVDDAVAWGEAALEALGEEGDARSASDPDARVRADRVRDALARAGGVLGDPPPDPNGAEPEDASATTPDLPERPTPDLHPRRDGRFHGEHNFNFPPHNLYADRELDAEERNLALLCKRLLEMDVPEMMASFLVERRDMPWDFYLDYARQLWDEARHSMMGEVAFEARGVDWRAIPLNVGFSLRLNLHAEPLERQLMLWAIEQSLMPGESGKRMEYETAREAGDALSAHFHDYDWADEVLHARIGRRWLLGDEGESLSFDEAMERGRAVHEKTWSALAPYREAAAQTEWWTDFVREVLGRESGADPEQLVEDPSVITE